MDDKNVRVTYTCLYLGIIQVRIGLFDKHLAGFPKSRSNPTASVKENISHPPALDKYMAQSSLQCSPLADFLIFSGSCFPLFPYNIHKSNRPNFVSSLKLLSCVILAKLPNISEAQVPLLKMGKINKITYMLMSS